MLVRAERLWLTVVLMMVAVAALLLLPGASPARAQQDGGTWDFQAHRAELERACDEAARVLDWVSDEYTRLRAQHMERMSGSVLLRDRSRDDWPPEEVRPWDSVQFKAEMPDPHPHLERLKWNLQRLRRTALTDHWGAMSPGSYYWGDKINISRRRTVWDQFGDEETDGPPPEAPVDAEPEPAPLPADFLEQPLEAARAELDEIVMAGITGLWNARFVFSGMDGSEGGEIHAIAGKVQKRLNELTEQYRQLDKAGAEDIHALTKKFQAMEREIIEDPAVAAAFQAVIEDMQPVHAQCMQQLRHWQGFVETCFRAGPEVFRRRQLDRLAHAVSFWSEVSFDRARDEYQLEVWPRAGKGVAFRGDPAVVFESKPFPALAMDIEMMEPSPEAEDQPPAYPDSLPEYQVRWVAGVAVGEPSRRSPDGPWSHLLPLHLNEDVPHDARILLFYGGNFLSDDPSAPPTIVSLNPDIEYEMLEVGPVPWWERAALSEYHRAWLTLSDHITREFTPAQQDVFAAADKILLLARFRGGAATELKRLTINGVPAEWVLAQGNVTAAVRIVSADEDADLRDVVFLHDQFRVEIELSAPIHREQISFNLIDLDVPVWFPGAAPGEPSPRSAGDPYLRCDGQAEFEAHRVAPESTIYRSEVFHIAPQAPARSMGARILNIPAGRSFAAVVPAAEAVSMRSPGVATVHTTPAAVNSLWKDYVLQAARLHDVAIEDWDAVAAQPAAEIWKFTFDVRIDSPWQRPKWGQTIKLTIGDHAAMLLLRAVFLDSMQQVKHELDALGRNIPDPAMRADAYVAFIAQSLQSPRSPFAHMETSNPFVAGGSVPLRQMFDRAFLNTFRTRDLAHQWVREAATKAIEEYRANVDAAIVHAQSVPEDDCAALLSLVSVGFEPIAARIKPRMLKLEGTPETGLRWVPDRIARAYVSSNYVLGNRLIALEELASAQRNIVLCTAAFGVLAPETLAFRVILAGIEAASVADVWFVELPQFLRHRADYRFALGAAGVLGPDRIELAAARSSPDWAFLLNAGFAHLGLGGEAMRLIGAVRLGRVEAQAQRALSRIETGGVESLRVLDTEERAAFAAMLAEAQRLRDRGMPLSELQSRALKVMDAEASRAVRIPASRRIDPPNWQDAPTWSAGRDANNAPVRSTFNYAAYGLPPEDGGGITLITGQQRVFRIGRCLGRGSYACVYELVDQPGSVIKFFYGEREKAQGLAQRAFEMSQLLKRHNIPQLEVTEVYADSAVPFVIQQRLKPGMMTVSYGEPAITKWRVLPGRTLSANPTQEELREAARSGVIDVIERVPQLPDGQRLSRPLQDAVLRLFKTMAAEKVVWEDGHLENIYFFKDEKRLRWVAGVLDHDRLAHWDTPLDQVDDRTVAQMYKLEAGADGVTSLRDCVRMEDVPIEQHQLPDADFFMQKALEYGRRWIMFDPETKSWTGHNLDLDLVEQYFPGFRDHHGPSLDLNVIARQRAGRTVPRPD